jgi:simple sugar transport system ATP-binding protein
VARSIYSNPTVLIMDEPLAALGVRESQLVLNLVLELKKRGDISIILIAHNYAQVFEVCDRINFLSGGKIVYDTRTRDTTVANLIDLVTSGYKVTNSASVASTVANELP